jgi:hypothetical protein
MAKKAKARKTKKAKAKKVKAKKAGRAAGRTSRKAVARKAAKAKKTRSKKTAAKRGTARTTRAKTAAAAHPDKRVPVGDGVHEILYKWDVAAKQYRFKEVPIGGDWQLSPKARRVARNTSKKARKSAKAGAKKGRSKKAAAKKGMARTASAETADAGHPDKRVPVGDGAHEILYKWDVAANQYRSREVPIGGDWS